MKVVQLDVCNEEQVNKAVDHIKEILGESEAGRSLGNQIDHIYTYIHKRSRLYSYISFSLTFSCPVLWAVVNNAGVSTFGEVEFTSMDTYKHVSEVNLWGTIRVTKAVLPLIRRAKGKLHFVP